MGTRGYIVFVHKGKWYAMYQHFDAYAMWSNLSNEIADLMIENSEDDIIKMFEVIVWHDGTIPATDEEVELLREYADLRVSWQDPHDWYVLLRKTQGSFLGMIGSGHAYGSIGEGDVPEFDEMTCVVDFDKQLVGDKPFGHRQGKIW
jgi:hypothetical protein